MNNENQISASFFDDEEGLFRFMKPNPKHQELFSDLFILKDQATCKCLASQGTKQGVFALYSHFIVFYENANPNTPKAIIDINYSRLMTLSFHANPAYGFKLTKNNAAFEFYFADSKTSEYWTDALRNICVMTNFHAEYKAVKLLGQGGFARVYLSESKTTGKLFAVKAFLKEAQMNTYKSNYKAPLRHEIEMLRLIDHTNVVKLCEVQETDRTVYLVMEYVESKTLQEIIKKPDFRNSYSDTQIISFVHSILDVLSYLASKGIMHRDLKPDNILVEKGGKIKIIDLGLATPVDLPKHIFKRCGTPGYIAPEVFAIDPQSASAGYDEKCDLFSVGCILYFLLFGAPIFGTAKNSYLFNLNKHCSDEKIAVILSREASKPENNKQIHKEGLLLLKELLVVDPKKRASADDVLYHAFFNPILNTMIRFTSSKNIIFASSPHLNTTNVSQNVDSSQGNNNHCIYSFKGENGNLTPVKNKCNDKDSFCGSSLSAEKRRSSANEQAVKLSKFGNQAANNKSGFMKSQELNEIFVGEGQKK